MSWLFIALAVLCEVAGTLSLKAASQRGAATAGDGRAGNGRTGDGRAGGGASQALAQSAATRTDLCDSVSTGAGPAQAEAPAGRRSGRVTSDKESDRDSTSLQAAGTHQTRVEVPGVDRSGRATSDKMSDWRSTGSQAAGTHPARRPPRTEPGRNEPADVDMPGEQTPNSAAAMTAPSGRSRRRGPWLWWAIVAVGYVAAFSLISAALAAGMPLSVAYGVWAAAGVALTAVLSAVFFKESLTWFMGLGLALVMGGVLLIEAGGH